MELVTGATGYVGGRLLRRLAGEGRPVRALARRPESHAGRGGAGARRPPHGDRPRGGARRLLQRLLPRALDGAGRERRLRRARPAHGRELRRGGGPRRSRADRLPRRHRAGSSIRRHPTSTRASRSRRSCSTAVPGSTALRASIVIGAGSSSFRHAGPAGGAAAGAAAAAWRKNRTAPIDERDVIEFLARTPAVPAAAGRSLDVAGPDVMTYGRMIEQIAEEMGVGRMPLGAGRLAHAARERGGGGRDRPADRARAAADAEPRDRPAAARPGRGAAPLRPAPAPASSGPSSTRSPSGRRIEPLGAR